MPESPIRKLASIADEAKRKGTHVYHLNIGQPDIPTPANAIQAVQQANLTVIEYSHSAGNLSYRKKLARFYQRLGISVDENQIMVTTGGSEAITFGLMSCMDNGDEIIVPEPFYANYNGFVTAAGVKIKPITSYIDDGFALPPIEEFEKAITPKTKAILINNPNNPTGYLYTREELLQIRDLVKKYDLFLFSDEVYSEFCYTDEPYFSVMQLEGIEEHTILIDSISKRYSSCGIRIGAMITRNEEVLNTAMKFAQARLSPPSLGQIAAEAALDAGSEYLQDVYREYLERRNFLVEALNQIDGVYCPEPKGAFYVMAQLPVDDTEKFAAWILSEFEYEQGTVMVAPGSGFYATPGLGKDEIRIAYVLGIQELKKAMAILEKALEVYPGRTQPEKKKHSQEVNKSYKH